MFYIRLEEHQENTTGRTPSKLLYIIGLLNVATMEIAFGLQKMMEFTCETSQKTILICSWTYGIDEGRE